MSDSLHLFAEFHHSGDHEAAWRLPTSSVDRLTDPEYYIERTRIAAEGGFDAVFLADFVGFDPMVEHVVRWPHEPTTLAAAITSAVADIGVVTTASTVFSTPDQLFATFTSLADISDNRVGWNIVTAGSPAAARSFGLETVPDHDRRYALAADVVDELTTRWDRIAARPLYAQAGASPAGLDFAARFADVVFTATPDLDAARRFRTDLRERCRAAGRPADAVSVLPGLLVTVAATERQARARRHELDSLLTDDMYRILLSLYGIDFATVDLDAPFTTAGIDADELLGIRSRLPVIERIARTLGPRTTARELVRHVAGSRGHLQITGDPWQVADTIETWYRRGGCDGFVVKFAHNPGGAEEFVDLVVPLLRERGLLVSPPEGSCLRARFGRTVPSRAGRITDAGG